MSGLSYNGLNANPMPGLPGWFDVPAADGLHFCVTGPDGSLRCEVRWRDDGSATAELWRRGDDGGTLLWSQAYRRGEPGWNPYRDVLSESSKAGLPVEYPARARAQDRGPR